MTAADIEDLARQRWGEPNTALSSRNELRFGHKGSVSVRLDDGRYYDHEQQHGGCLVKSKLKDRVPWPPPKRNKRQVQRPPLHQPAPLQKNNLRACGVWHQSVPLNRYNDAGEPTTGNPDAVPAIRYLEGRAINLWPWPETLSFARLTHPETKEQNIPALILARQCPASRLLRGIQRIFLTEDGKKYPRGTVKMSLGSIAGGRAELIPATGEELAIAEGVESALSAHILLGIPAWACCGSFPDFFLLPERVRRVTIVADADASGGSGKKAKVLRSYLRKIYRVKVEILVPDVMGQDANDVLLHSDGR